jgi:hypothetical protein
MSAEDKNELERFDWQNFDTSQERGGRGPAATPAEPNIMYFDGTSPQQVPISCQDSVGRIHDFYADPDVDSGDTYWWMGFAACKDNPGPFEYSSSAAEALRICAKCPFQIREECREYGDTHNFKKAGILYDVTVWDLE